MALLLSSINSDLRVNGSFTCESFNCPDGALDNAAIVAGAAIDASKVNHRIHKTHVTAPGTAVTAATSLVHVATVAGVLTSVKAVCVVAPTTTDTVTIDVKKSTAGGAFATVLSGTIVLDNANTNLVVENGSIASDDYVANDIFEVVVTVSGTSAQGLIVSLCFEENGV